MGMTKRHARSGIGERPATFKRIGPLKLALGALALLMVSGVLAQSGGNFVLDPDVVPGGGAISSSGGIYSLGSTVGQTGAGTVSGGGYTLYGGFWKPGTLIPGGGDGGAKTIYVAAILRSPPVVVLPCNDGEQNDLPRQAKELTTRGSTCAGSLEDDPQGEDDYYSVDVAAGQTLSIDLNGIPDGADYNLLLYSESDVITPVVRSSNTNKTDEHLVYLSTAGGQYFIRINMFRKSTIANNTYYLRAVLS